MTCMMVNALLQYAWWIVVPSSLTVGVSLLHELTLARNRASSLLQQEGRLQRCQPDRKYLTTWRVDSPDDLPG